MDRERATEIITDYWDQFFEMYDETFKEEPFRDLIKFENGVFKGDWSPEARAELMMHLNDNLFQNMEYISYQSYDDSRWFTKIELSEDEMWEDI